MLLPPRGKVVRQVMGVEYSNMEEQPTSVDILIAQPICAVRQ